jgi:hypothetical protein
VASKYDLLNNYLNNGFSLNDDNSAAGLAGSLGKAKQISSILSDLGYDVSPSAIM